MNIHRCAFFQFLGREISSCIYLFLFSFPIFFFFFFFFLCLMPAVRPYGQYLPADHLMPLVIYLQLSQLFQTPAGAGSRLRHSNKSPQPPPPLPPPSLPASTILSVLTQRCDATIPINNRRFDSSPVIREIRARRPRPPAPAASLRSPR